MKSEENEKVKEMQQEGILRNNAGVGVVEVILILVEIYTI